jgi:hypothetical protein
MKRRFKESMLADEVVVFTEKRLKALIASLKRERDKEEAFSAKEFVGKNYITGERSRGIALGMTKAIAMIEGQLSKK